MRYKINIEFIQSLDPNDIYRDKKAYEKRGKKKQKEIQEHITSYLRNAMCKADTLEGSIYYAQKQGTFKIDVQYIDDDYELERE